MKSSIRFILLALSVQILVTGLPVFGEMGVDCATKAAFIMANMRPLPRVQPIDVNTLNLKQQAYYYKFLESNGGRPLSETELQWVNDTLFNTTRTSTPNPTLSGMGSKLQGADPKRMIPSLESENVVSKLLVGRIFGESFRVFQNPIDYLRKIKLDPSMKVVFDKLQKVISAARRFDGLTDLTRAPDLLVEDRLFDIYTPDGAKPDHIAANILIKVEKGQTKRIIVNLLDYQYLNPNISNSIYEDLLSTFDIPHMVPVIRQLREVWVIKRGVDGEPRKYRVWP